MKENASGVFFFWTQCRAVPNCVQRTCTRKKLAPDWPTHTCKFLVQEDLHKFLVQVSWACVDGYLMCSYWAITWTSSELVAKSCNPKVEARWSTC